MVVKVTDILHALIANKIHASFCARSGMSDRAAAHYFKRECTCWVETDEGIILVP